MPMNAAVWFVNVSNAQFFSIVGLCISVMLLGVLLDLNFRSSKSSQELAKVQSKDRAYGISLPTIPEENSISFEIKVE